MSKKSPIRLDDFPEVFVSDKTRTSAVSKAVKAGRLRKIGSRLYTRNMTSAPEDIVRKHWHVLLKEYFPDALIADRTALENKPAPDGSVFIISAGSRAVELPGITYKPRIGIPALESDLPFAAGVRLSSTPRAWLENMRMSRSGNSVSRTLNNVELEERLESMLRRGGESTLNQLRDQARGIAAQLGMSDEFKRLNDLIGTFLGTRDSRLVSSVGQARRQGLPYDPVRLDLFIHLFNELRRSAPSIRTDAHMTDRGKTNLAFFESYFSNYIEGTEFLVEEAMDIVFHGFTPVDRPQDAHDILGTFRIVSDDVEMRRQPRQTDDFIRLLKTRQAGFMDARPEKRPGQFKSQDNRAGSTLFVAPELVPGTLEKGFDIHQGLEAPLHRAIFMMFLVSEVHPFADGNGRAARIMMNAELVAGREQKIIIPTVFRNNYLSALKAFSQTGNGAPLIRMLDFAQRYTVSIPWDDFDTARALLQATNAFHDANEAEHQGIRLVMPETHL
jgi:hypothetical protein